MPIGPQMTLVGIYTYEEGTDGVAVATGNGVVYVSGGVTYSATYAQQGNLGLQLTSGTSAVVDYAYTLPQTGSVYLKRGPETPTNRVNFIVFVDSGAIPVGAIGIKKTGEWMLQDSAGNLLQTSTHVTAPGDAFRVDWQVSYSSSTLSWTARFFADPNSATYTEMLTASATGNQPIHTRFTTFNGQTLGVDTLRLWDDTSTWPDPYVVAAPGYAITVWNGTQEVAVSSVTVWDGTQELPASIDGIQ